MKEENTIMTITKDMRIGDLLQMNEMIAPFLMQNGMGCVYCPSSMMESLEEACLVPGIDCNHLRCLCRLYVHRCTAGCCLHAQCQKQCRC